MRYKPDERALKLRRNKEWEKIIFRIYDQGVWISYKRIIEEKKATNFETR